MIRLNQFLSQSGVTSRRKADEKISRGEVKVNGNVCTTLGTTIDPEKDTVTVLKTTTTPPVWFQIKRPETTVTYALYKPRGYVTSLTRQTKDPIVTSLLPKNPRVFPIGRLDKDSEGLLLMTNDGDLAQLMTHPTTHVQKTYEVTCVTPGTWTEQIAKRQLGRIAGGVVIGEYRTRPVKIRLLDFASTGKVLISITMKEGKNRQIRRMLGTINLEVIQLKRTAIGGLKLHDLKIQPKDYTQLTHEQLTILKSPAV